MPLHDVIASLPAYAEDLRMNYDAIIRRNTELSAVELWGTIVASSVATRSAALRAAAEAAAAEWLLPALIDAAKTAAALMAMNNIYFRFHHLVGDETYASLPSGLRMNGQRTHAARPLHFELWCVAVSAINGCAACVAAHERVLRSGGISAQHINHAVRVASIVHALGTVLDAEQAGMTLNGDLMRQKM